MPRYIAKLAENKYVEWSTIVDAPVTYVLTRERMLEYLDVEYGRSCYQENRERLERTDKNGTSSHYDCKLEDLISYNRAGKKGAHLTLEEILVEYDLKNQTVPHAQE